MHLLYTYLVNKDKIQISSFSGERVSGVQLRPGGWRGYHQVLQEAGQ